MAATTPSTSLDARSAAAGGAPAGRSLDGIKIIARCGANYPRLVAPVNPVRHAFHLRIARVCGDRVHGT
jgi:hypothetical protein